MEFLEEQYCPEEVLTKYLYDKVGSKRVSTIREYIEDLVCEVILKDFDPYEVGLFVGGGRNYEDLLLYMLLARPELSHYYFEVYLLLKSKQYGSLVHSHLIKGS